MVNMNGRVGDSVRTDEYHNVAHSSLLLYLSFFTESLIAVRTVSLVTRHPLKSLKHDVID